MATTFLLVSIAGLLLTVNAWRPVPSVWVSVPVFFAGWLTAELAPLLLVFHVAGVIAFAVAGALTGWQGRTGLALSIVVAAGLVAIIRESLRVREVLERALLDGLGPDYLRRCLTRRPDGYDPRLPWPTFLMPFWLRSKVVRRTRSIPYAEDGGMRNRLDIYHDGTERSGRPVLLYVHGGGWSPVSNKNHQGKPLMLHLAARGWLCVSANYRVSPRVAFPDHLIDVKRALAWVRAHAHAFGGDPSFVAVAGGSAGGHLAALLALTENDPEYQPGFEDANTSIQACIPLYGVYDFVPDQTLKMAERRLWFIERYVMQKKHAEHRAEFEKASPYWRVRDDAPPFFVIHGSNDTLVPVAEARAFVARLREVTRKPVVYAELSRTQHAFDVFHSIRTAYVVRAVERFCDYVLATRAETEARR